MSSRSTVITHIYNEEYLLPWWLAHHKDKFDHGIVINYHSTDSSLDLVKSICPTWDIVTSRNEMFDAHQIDREVEDIERNVDGWRICLNTTEFLIGNFSLLKEEHSPGDFLIPACVMVDDVDQAFTQPTHDQSLMSQRTFGISPYSSREAFYNRRARKLSNYFSSYPLGRHYENYNTEDFLILWYGFAPFNEQGLQRKLQIQHRIPHSDKVRGWGAQHLASKDQLIQQLSHLQQQAQDLTPLICRYE